MITKTIQGVEVPALGFGTWQMRGNDCLDGVAHALSLGYRHIDTAQMYQNESQVGQAINASNVNREDIFLTTKIHPDNVAPDDVRRSTEGSLQKLGTGYVDLLLIHWPSDDVPVELTLKAMLKLKDEGKIHNIGVSNFTPELVDEAQQHAPIFCNQVEYHPFLSQQELLEQSQSDDILLTAYSPLGRGRVMADDVLNEIAKAKGKSPAQVALRWLIQQDQVAAIPKASSADHRESNFNIFDFELSDDEMERIFELHRNQRIVDPPELAPSW